MKYNVYNFSPSRHKAISYLVLIIGIPKSLQIFLPVWVLISLCLGTVEVLLFIELSQTVCEPPSLTKIHPHLRICFTRSICFIKNQAKTAKLSRVIKDLPSDFLDKRRLVSRISKSASFKFSLVSISVLPWVFTPGISSIQPEYHLPDFL